MARYIDADVLHIQMEDLYEHHIEMHNFSADGAVADCLDLLDNAPTADVVEVKHGHWIKQGNEKKCSVCEFVYYSNNDDWNGCPNCLAKMDGGNKNEL